MSHQQHDEIDLVYVIGKLKQTIKNWISLAFKALDYALKYWYVILILAIVGFGFGYYKMKDYVNPQKSSVIVKINYNLQPYVMNAIELYNNKAIMYDSTFLRNMGYNPYNPQIKEVLLEPVIDFKDIIEKYQINERGLDMLLNRVDFDDEELPIQDILMKEYSYFKFEFSLSGYAKEADVERFFEFLNKDEKLQVYKTNALKNFQDAIEENNKSLSLINGVLEGYTVADVNPSVQTDKGFDLSRIFESKLIIQDRNQELKNELAVSNDITVPLHQIMLREGEPRILSRKHIVYPIFLVFAFLFISYLRYLYFYFRRIARENN